LTRLKAEPDWVGAAQAFVAGLEAQGDPDGRVEFLDACRAAFGEQIYPGFLKLLAAVSAMGDLPTRALCAETLAHALSTGRLPATRVAAFGGGAPNVPSIAGLSFGGGFGRLATNLRSAGPIEFLCLWLTRDIIDERLEPDGFRAALTHIVELVNSSPRAAALYRGKLLADADNPMEGLHNHESRALVRALAIAWEEDAVPSAVVERTLAAAAAKPPPHDPFAGMLR
jgi:hypothetical protein